MKKVICVLGFCCFATGAFAQPTSIAQKKIGLVPDTAITLQQHRPYVTAPTRLDLTMKAPGCMPFFCRQEVKWEQTLKFPLRIRLGSVDQANWLEQKGDRYLLFK